MLKTTQAYLSVPILALSVFLFSACGGGGGGDSGDDTITPTGVSITTDNAELIAAKVFESVGMVEGITDTVDLVTGVSVTVSDTDFTYADLVLWLLQQNQQLAVQSTLEAVTGVVIDYPPMDCLYGGTYTITGEDVDPAGPSAGDTLDYTFDACGLAENFVLNGGMGFTIIEYTGDPATVPYIVEVDTYMDNLSISDGSLVVTSDGDMGIRLMEDGAGNETLTISGVSFSATADGHYETVTDYRYDLRLNSTTGDYSIDLNGTYASDTIGGSVNFATLTTFTGSDLVADGNPTEGVLHISSTFDSSQERLTALLDGNVYIEVDADGDGIYEDDFTTTWAALDSL